MVQIPKALVVESGGQKFFKLQCTHPAVCKLLCGQNTALFQGSKNPSMAGSSRLQMLKDSVQQALRNAVMPPEPAGVFEDEKGAGNPPKKRQKKLPHPDSLEVDVCGSKVVVLTPQNFKAQDVFVLMDKEMLENVFGFLHKDRFGCQKEAIQQEGAKQG